MNLVKFTIKNVLWDTAIPFYVNPQTVSTTHQLNPYDHSARICFTDGSHQDVEESINQVVKMLQEAEKPFHCNQCCHQF